MKYPARDQIGIAVAKAFAKGPLPAHHEVSKALIRELHPLMIYASA